MPKAANQEHVKHHISHRPTISARQKKQISNFAQLLMRQFSLLSLLSLHSFASFLSSLRITLLVYQGYILELYIFAFSLPF
ncbi:hypothetical protein BDV35DRAFT_349138 [Aspergillus flavus]|uniref:Uncharacterized protein n=1 Tax=Aspergillus flavus TaxID=5059 RepID=A0A5N6H1J5_ASPFL|nr:hypothetical protein BDV35DRAFT_349138 [Aspergillus flavus]